MGLSVVLNNSAPEHYFQHGCLIKGKKKAQEIQVFNLAYAVNCSLWLMRNILVFQGEIFYLCGVVDLIKIRSWNWFAAAKDRNCCPFFRLVYKPNCMFEVSRLILSSAEMVFNKCRAFNGKDEERKKKSSNLYPMDAAAM